MRRSELEKQVERIENELFILRSLLEDEEEETRPGAPVQKEEREEETAYLTIADVVREWKISASTLHRWIKAGRFPPGRMWGARSRRWKRTELEGY